MHGKGRRPNKALHPTVATAQQFGAAEALREKAGTPIFPVDRSEYEKCLATARTQLDAAPFTAAWQTGYALALDQAVALALDTNALPGRRPE